MLTSLLVLQASSLCNLNCAYCYVPGRRDSSVMSDEVLEAAIKCFFNSSFSHADCQVNNRLKVLWHAGEPLSVKQNYYAKALKLFNLYNKQQIKLCYAIQTNATLINQKWCDFFIENNFEITISVDGPQFINDRNRRNWNDKASFTKVMRGMEHLVNNNMPLRAISVLTNYSLDYPDEIYHFFSSHGFEAVGFNIDEKEGSNTNSSLISEADPLQQQNIVSRYTRFMQRLYDLWIADGRKFEIREFNSALSSIALRKAGSDQLYANETALAFAIITVSKEGNITTFDPEIASGISNQPNYFSIGNVMDISSYDECISNANFQNQLRDIGEGIKRCAESCDYFDFCGGGCPSNKFYEHGTFAATETINCRLTVKSIIDLMIHNLSI